MEARWFLAAVDSPEVGVSLCKKVVNPWLTVLVGIGLHLIVSLISVSRIMIYFARKMSNIRGQSQLRLYY